MTDQVTSIEQSKRLIELGVPAGAVLHGSTQNQAYD